MYKYLYGPIPSRRLGVSLGVDPIPHKTCPLNCVYCECGATTVYTKERKEYVPSSEILNEIRHFLASNPAPDYITFSGSGEPTLHSGLGEMIRTIKKEYPHIKVAVLTNSVMLDDSSLPKELMAADLVAPSLDAVSPEVFKRIDVPLPGIDISQIPSYLQEFARTFLAQEGKELWVEIFVVEGINTTPSEIEKFACVLNNMPYSRIQLNRLDRIGTVKTLLPTSMEKMYSMQDELLEAGLHDVEVVGKCKKRDEIRRYHHTLEEAILENLGRRSHSLDDLMDLTGLTAEEIGGYLDLLAMEKKLEARVIDSKIVYSKIHS
ncbi:MAG: radical SAM protein [Brevinema sp.]